MVRLLIFSSTANPLANKPQSLRIVPTKQHLTSTAPLTSAPSAPGVHDTLRARVDPIPSAASTNSNNANLQSSHPLEQRLSSWRATQDALHAETLRRQFGIAAPVRRAMELDIVRKGEWRPAVLGMGLGGKAGVHEDVLSGRDTEIGWEDVFGGKFELFEMVVMEGEANVVVQLARSSARCRAFTARWRRDSGWAHKRCTGRREWQLRCRACTVLLLGIKQYNPYTNT